MQKYLQKISTYILFLCSVLPLQAEIHSASWGTDDTIDNNPNIIALYKLNNWQLDNNRSKSSYDLPLFSSDEDTLVLSNFFDLPADTIRDEIVFKSLGFNGVAEISINNSLLATKPNSSAPFNFSIDKSLLKPGQKNTITILLTKSSGLNKSFPVFTNIYSEPEYIGIVRPFYIEYLKPRLISDFKYSIQYENYNPDFNYEYLVNSEIINSLSKTDGLMLEQVIIDSEGKEVTSRVVPISKRNTNVSGGLSLLPARFWSADIPVFLNFSFTLKRFAQPLMRFTKKIALRSISAGKKEIFFNNKVIPIKGINYYQNLKFRDKTSLLEQIKSDLQSIKNDNFNAIRFVTHIPDERYLSVADTLGLMVFIDVPVKRYPSLAFKQDVLLENLQSTIKSTVDVFKEHPSFTAIGLGQEVLLSDAGTSKFYIILDGSIDRDVPFLTYITPVPESNMNAEQAADFYMLDVYDSITKKQNLLKQTNIAYTLVGKAAMSSAADYLDINRTSFGVDHKILIKKNVNTILSDLSMQGGFLESYMDWYSKFPTNQTYFNSNPYLISNGFYDTTFVQKEWVSELGENAWDDSASAQLETPNGDKSSNVFSITMFFSSLLFLFFYRRYPRLSENYRRSLKHPYGFYVEMRERRIIPVFNSFIVGVHNTLLMTIFISSFIYFYNDSLMTQEFLSVITIDKNIYNSLIKICQSEFILIPFIFIWLYFYPIVIGLILKLYGLFSKARIRLRQALAIGMWSGSPLIFLLPFSIAAYHLLLNGFGFQLIYIFIIFIIWIHFRLINGIRVLILAKFRTIFILLLLSYIIPLIIFSVFFSPQPMWSDYLITLINSHELF
jgi:Glycosyl hydrolases family 2, TIM barrel domain